MPSWSAFNSVVSKETLSQKIVGFCQLFLVQTVYTELPGHTETTFTTHLVVTCDESVYHIAREITMGNATEFENIVLCLGSFHMSKIFL